MKYDGQSLERVLFVKTLPCVAAHAGGCSEIIEFHHEPPKSAGSDDFDGIPACTVHHRLRHHRPNKFMALLGCASKAEYRLWLKKKKREIDWLFLEAHKLATSYAKRKESRISTPIIKTPSIMRKPVKKIKPRDKSNFGPIVK